MIISKPTSILCPIKAFYEIEAFYVFLTTQNALRDGGAWETLNSGADWSRDWTTMMRAGTKSVVDRGEGVLDRLKQ